MNNNVAVICSYPFPIGYAATNRIIAYAKGLVHNGVLVDVYVYNPSDYKKESFSNPGVYQGVNYFYPAGRIRRKNKILHGFEMIKGIYLTLKKIKEENCIKQYRCIIISSETLYVLYFFSRLAQKLNTKSIFIFDEYPIPIRKYLKSKIPKLKQFLFSKVLPHISAYVSMTSSLAAFYCKITPKKTLIFPSVTDISCFDNDSFCMTPQERKYICYMGNMELSKDNVDNIIRAFYLVADIYKDIDLHLYGSPSQKDKMYLEQLINELNLNDRVIFKGKVDREVVPKILKSAYILVSSQPNTKRAEGGFPTKLGEYLATSVPVLLTNVGEISKYINDSEQAFLVPPTNPQLYADKLIYIINNYQTALGVARVGRQFLYDNYSHIIMGKKLADFIKEIK